MMALTQASDPVQASVLDVSTASLSSMSMLQQEIGEQVLGITGENIQSPTVKETVIKDGQVFDPTNEGDTSPALYTEHHAPDLSMNCSNTSSPHNSPAHTPSVTCEFNQYLSGGEDKSSAFEANKMISEDKSHIMQNSMEDIVDAEIFTSLKTGATAGEPELSSNMEERLPEEPTHKRQKKTFEDLKSEHLDSSIDSLKSLNDKQKTYVEGTDVNDNGSSALSDVQKHKRSDMYRAQGDALTYLKEMYKTSQTLSPFHCVSSGHKNTSDIYLSATLYGFLIPYKCGICGKTCADLITLCHHIKAHKTLLYKCDVCEKKFQYRFSLKFHMKLHKTEKSSTAGYSNTERARVDSKSSAEKSIYECEVCGKRLQQGDEFIVHMQSHKSRTCKLCMKEFSNLSSHMRQHSEDKPYSCNICDKSYGFSGALASHVKVHLEHKTSRIKNKKRMENDKSAKKDEPYGCKICAKSFRFGGAFTSHVMSHLVNTIRRVRNKKRMETDKSAKNDHLSSLSSYTYQNYFGRLQCWSCSKSFPSRHQLQNHAVYHSEPNFKCLICNREFYRKYQLQVHLISHTGFPSHKCKLCNQSFLFSFSLRMHMRIHTSIRLLHRMVEPSPSI